MYPLLLEKNQSHFLIERNWWKYRGSGFCCAHHSYSVPPLKVENIFIQVNLFQVTIFLFFPYNFILIPPSPIICYISFIYFSFFHCFGFIGAVVYCIRKASLNIRKASSAMLINYFHISSMLSIYQKKFKKPMIERIY